MVEICEVCEKELSPKCNMKKYKGRTYCIDCYVKKIWPTLVLELKKNLNDIDVSKIEPPKGNCLKPSPDFGGRTYAQR